jgi:DNA-binding XRE family transcriptional regulator
VRILFDQGTPVPLRGALAQHEVATAYEQGWSQLNNGELLDAAERGGFEVFVTTDSRLRHQQNLTTRRIAIVCLLSTSWPRIHRAVEAVVNVINSCSAGSYAKKRATVTVGDSVRILRELQEMSQNQLAEGSGIPQATISAIENDRVRLGVERAKVLARALRCHPAVLVFPGWTDEEAA